MLPEPVQEALWTLSADVDAHPELADALRALWRTGVAPPELAKDLRAAGELVAAEVPAITRSADGRAALGELFSTQAGDLLFSWCAASTGRRNADLAPLLHLAAPSRLRTAMAKVVHDRVVEGPLVDALNVAPLLGDGAVLSSPESSQARSRLRILLWEAGASALEVPALGPWFWGSESVFEEMIHGPARGTLRGRVLAARCLEISACGMPANAQPGLVDRTLQVIQPLLFHPEPLVWVHAARALGRLTGPLEQLQGMLLDWVQGDAQVMRQRAITAFASLPADRLKLGAGQLIAIVQSKDEEPWVLAAVCAATPYLFFERRDVWDRLKKRVLAGVGGAITARALARGLATLHRRGIRSDDVETPLYALREMARAARPTTLDESRRWIEVTAITDPLDAAERDPLDLELGLENLIRVAAQYDDEEADARAARFATALPTTFQEARRLALGTRPLRQRAAAISAMEGLARAFALRLWSPMLATRPAGVPIEEPELEETWNVLSKAPAELLDVVKERRQEGETDIDAQLPLEVLAIRLGGYALDACGEGGTLGPGRGQTAHDTCLWLRKIAGLADGTRELPPPLKGALSTLFWRLVDTTRGTSLGEVDDVEWLGPFAAWWALVIDRPEVLLTLATALPMMSPAALETCCEQAAILRAVVETGDEGGAWGADAAESLAALHAEGTALSEALSGLAAALASFTTAKGPRPDLEPMCLALVLAADGLQAALADPVRALHAVADELGDDSLTRHATENAPRVAALVARAIRARELSMVDVWLASLGPVASGLLEAAIRSAIRRTPPPPPKQKKPEPKMIQGYELVKPLGEGGIGSVWLVRKPGADRFFVLKIPKAEALATATDAEREGILASFVEEAKALAGLYHPNVANIIDRGVSEDAPFLVLEYLIGADLKQYAEAHLMSLFELRQVVLESCAGLSALHSAGLVHRDIKPANLWLRLPLAGGERFDGPKHRNPAVVPPLATVVIDFGMVRAIRVAPEVGGRFVAGTPGYMAPEQVLDPVELDPRADVYALAATIYNVTTGRAFFDEIQNPRDRIIAHMRRDPFEDVARLAGFPASVAKLMRQATVLSPVDRPHPMQFGREFAAALLAPASPAGESTMRYNVLGKTGLYVSQLCLGAMTFGGKGFWEVVGKLGASEVEGIVGGALDAGVNFLDTADVYSEGESETLVGGALKALGRPREQVVVATKVRGRVGPGVNQVGLSRAHILSSIDGSLKRLGLDHVDLYQIHGFDPSTPIEETVRALDAVVQSGKARYVGFSNLPAWLASKAITYADAHGLARFQSGQVYYSIAGRDIEREIVPMAQAEQLAILPWSPLAGGLLSGKFDPDKPGPEGARRTSFDFPPVDRGRLPGVLAALRTVSAQTGLSVARIALAWHLTKPFVTSVIIGAKNRDQLIDNLAAVDVVLTPEQIALLDSSSALPPEYPGWMLDFQNREQRGVQGK